LRTAGLDRHRQADPAASAGGQLGDGGAVLLIDQDAGLNRAGQLWHRVQQRLVDQHLVGADPGGLFRRWRRRQTVKVTFEAAAVVSGQDQQRPGRMRYRGVPGIGLSLSHRGVPFSQRGPGGRPVLALSNCPLSNSALSNSALSTGPEPDVPGDQHRA
jgi:hypothetical protein